MSSFICNPKHFNSIERELKLNLTWGRIPFPYTLKNDFPMFRGREYTPDTKEKEIKKIIDTLRELNVLCVSLQYRHHYETGALDLAIETQTNMIKSNRREFKDLTKRGLYNALRCLRYQIETEHLIELRGLTEYENKCIRFLNEMIVTLAMDIICDMEEDKSNRWEVS